MEGEERRGRWSRRNEEERSGEEEDEGGIRKRVSDGVRGGGVRTG